MPRLNPPGSFKNIGQGWFSCQICGTTLDRVEVLYNTASVEPTVGETITGATSGDTGVVEENVHYMGTYAGGDATGVIVLKNYTGASEGECFSSAEHLNGSTAGNNFATTTQAGAVKKSGIMWPRNQMARIDGKLYCKVHAKMVLSAETLDVEKYVPEEINDEY